MGDFVEGQIDAYREIVSFLVGYSKASTDAIELLTALKIRQYFEEKIKELEDG